MLIASLTTLLDVLYVASTAAFNVLVPSYVVLTTSSFMLAIGGHLFTGRRRIVPGWFHMGFGPIGFIVNFIAVASIFTSNIIFCFPFFAPPVTPATMNYTSLLSYELVVFVLIWWFAGGRKTYKSPKLSSETLQALEYSGVALEGVASGSDRSVRVISHENGDVKKEHWLRLYSTNNERIIFPPQIQLHK